MPLTSYPLYSKSNTDQCHFIYEILVFPAGPVNHCRSYNTTPELCTDLLKEYLWGRAETLDTFVNSEVFHIRTVPGLFISYNKHLLCCVHFEDVHISTFLPSSCLLHFIQLIHTEHLLLPSTNLHWEYIKK